MYKQNEIVSWGESRGMFDQPSFLRQIKDLSETTVDITALHTAHRFHCGPISDLQIEMGNAYIAWITACATCGLEPEACIDMAYKKITGRNEVLDSFKIPDPTKNL